MQDRELSHLPLGRKLDFSPEYDPSQLCAVPRILGRKDFISAEEKPSFFGVDIWNCWELSWLDKSGKPHIGVLELHIPANSPNLVESKSLKLYLNSFNMTKLNSEEELKKIIKKDIEEIVKAKVEIYLHLPQDFYKLKVKEKDKKLIFLDELEFKPEYGDKPFIIDEDKLVSQSLFSQLLRTKCPVTEQPDWASIHIDYTGRPISHEGLLNYLISLREEKGFHESCVEKIFHLILSSCKPEKLNVYARFTRRGGIDINPFRSTEDIKIENLRDIRQ